MHLVALVILLAAVEFAVFGALVGYARGKYGIKAPAIGGNEMFERHFRVHYNTMEQLVVFVPSIWFFGQYISAAWAAGIGSIFLIGRVIYGFSYVREPSKRELGALLSTLPSIVLLFGAIYGAIKQAFM